MMRTYVPVTVGAVASADLSDEFLRQWNAMALRLGINAIDLAAVGFSETGLRANGQRGGLIGFIPDTVRRLGWQGTIEQFWALDPMGQLPYVERYYQPYAGTGYLKNAGLVYVANFLPAYLKAASQSDDSFVLVRRDQDTHGWYRDNAVLDRNHDGVIDVGDLKAHLAIQDRGARWDSILARLKSLGAADNRTAPSARSGPNLIASVLVIGAAAAVLWAYSEPQAARALLRRVGL